MSASLANETTPDDTSDAKYQALLQRLSDLSVDVHFDAYGDIDWDEEMLAVDPADPRWELPAWDPLSRTEWYLSQPPEVRSRIGLHRVATEMKVGLQFENVLERGLLEILFKLPNGAPEFRYGLHEVIEESQHSLMFQEFVNRTGIDIRGLPWLLRVGANRVVMAGRWFPTLFFLFVLGGEDPIDHVQRELLRNEQSHPLLERIMRIHVTEEARHLSFARHYLRREVPRLGVLRRLVLTIATPLLLAVMSRVMLWPSVQYVRAYRVPGDLLLEMSRTDEARWALADSVGKVRRLVVELGLAPRWIRPLWRRLRIWQGTPKPEAVG